MNYPPGKKLSVNLQAVATRLNTHLGSVAGEEVAWVRVCCTSDKTLNYTSNVSREDGTKLLRDQVEHWEGKRADIPAHMNPDIKT